MQEVQLSIDFRGSNEAVTVQGRFMECALIQEVVFKSRWGSVVVQMSHYGVQEATGMYFL